MDIANISGMRQIPENNITAKEENKNE